MTSLDMHSGRTAVKGLNGTRRGKAYFLEKSSKIVDNQTPPGGRGGGTPLFGLQVCTTPKVFINGVSSFGHFAYGFCTLISN